MFLFIIIPDKLAFSKFLLAAPVRGLHSRSLSIFRFCKVFTLAALPDTALLTGLGTKTTEGPNRDAKRQPWDSKTVNNRQLHHHLIFVLSD